MRRQRSRQKVGSWTPATAAGEERKRVAEQLRQRLSKDWKRLRLLSY